MDGYYGLGAHRPGASMGPRPLGRGWPELREVKPKANASFNGAATARSRMAIAPPQRRRCHS